MKPDLSLKKENKILKNFEFSRVYRCGKRYKTKSLTILIIETKKKFRFGMTITRKIGNAVVRNKLKRRLREIIRTRGCYLFNGMDVVLIVQPDAVLKSFQDLSSELLPVLENFKKQDYFRKNSQTK